MFPSNKSRRRKTAKNAKNHRGHRRNQSSGNIRANNDQLEEIHRPDRPVEHSEDETSLAGDGSNKYFHPKYLVRALLRNVNNRGLKTASKDISSSSGVFDYLLHELHGTINESSHLPGNEETELQLSTLELTNIIRLPYFLEKFMCFTILTCFNTFLAYITTIPLRGIIDAFQLCAQFYRRYIRLPGRTTENGDAMSDKSHHKHSNASSKMILKHPRDFSRTVLIICGFILLSISVDTSRIYHSIRMQGMIKLYVMFGLFEVADKLCSSVGIDIIRCFINAVVNLSGKISQRGFGSLNASTFMKGIALFVVAVLYVWLHSIVLTYQLVTLHVAINSYSNALLSLLMSNQFSEIKSSVFKKFEREGLFQMALADVAERFQLLIFLVIIGIQNMVQASESTIQPSAWSSWNKVLGALVGPSAVVICSEIVVDCLKHAYITKFNHLRPEIYSKFLDVFVEDYYEQVSQSSLRTDRVGLSMIPLIVVFLRFLFISLRSIFSPYIPEWEPTESKVLLNSVFSKEALKYDSTIMIIALITLVCFMSLLVVKMTLGLGLLKYAQRRLAIIEKKNISIQKSETDIEDSFLSSTAVHTASKVFDSNLDSDFVPGSYRGSYGVNNIPENMRRALYEPEEKAPKSYEEIRNERVVKQQKKRRSSNASSSSNDFRNINRYQMVSKRIW